MRIPQFNRQVSDNSVPNVQVNGGMSAGEAASLVGNKTDSLIGALNSGLNAYQANQMKRTAYVLLMPKINSLN